MAKKKKKKIRAEFRKNREKPARLRDWTQQFAEHGFETTDPQQHERVSGKGEISRRRTVIGSENRFITCCGGATQLDEIGPNMQLVGVQKSVDGVTLMVAGQTRPCLPSVDYDGNRVGFMDLNAAVGLSPNTVPDANAVGARFLVDVALRP